MLFYIKKGFFSFLYLLFMLVLSLAISFLSDDVLILKYILSAVNLLFYCFIVASAGLKDGQDGIVIRNSNDLVRKKIVLTGDDLKLNLKEEYKPYKGFLIGTTICLPLFILMILHTILILTVGETCVWAGGVCTYIYRVVFGFFKMNSNSVLNCYDYYYIFIFAGIVIPMYGVCYILGGKREERQKKIADERRKAIYGENE